MNTGSFKGLHAWHTSGEIIELIDLANEKYENVDWKKWGEWSAPQVSNVWQINVDNVDSITLPSLAAPNGKPNLEGSVGFTTITGSIPRLIKGAQITAADLQTLREFQDEGNNFINQLRRMFITKQEKVLGGFHSQIMSWMYEILTSAEISVTAAMSQGNPYTAKFGVPSANKTVNASAAKWWDASGNEVSTADPIKDLQDMVKQADEDGQEYDSFKMSKELYDKFILHSKVKAAVVARISDNTNYKPNRAEMKLELASGFDIPEITVIDEQAKVNKGGKAVKADPFFNKKVVVLCKDSDLFEVRNVYPYIGQMSDNTTTYTEAEEGRIGILNEYKATPGGIYTTYELFAVPVLKNPLGLYIKTVY